MPAPMGDLGPCDLVFEGTSVGENISVNFRSSDDTAPVKTAAFGSANKDEIFTGRSCEVEAMLTQTTNTQLNAMMVDASVSGTELMVTTNVGTAMSDNRAKLIIKPVVGGVASADTTKWLTVFAACPKVDLDVVYDVDSQRTFKTTFTGFPATTVEAAASGETFAAGALWAIGYQSN